MSLLRFHYYTELSFSKPVCNNRFTLRMIPISDARQHINSCNIAVTPECVLGYDTDVFGNKYIYGEIEEAHSSFCAEMDGTAFINDNCSKAPIPYNENISFFSFFSQYTKPGDYLRAYYNSMPKKESESVFSYAERIFHFIYNYMEYVPGVTYTYTSAESAFIGRKGVCQDYTHIMLSLMRFAGIPCRYVVGMMKGEGFSHAWVEFHDGTGWIGVDPTNNKYIDNTYIKISHGRDYRDCIVNRGVFTGNAAQTQKISVVVKDEFI